MRISDWSSDVCSSDLVGAQRQLDRVGKAEILVDTVGERAEILHLVDDLILAAEDVRVVLRELAQAHKAVEGAVGLIAVQAAIPLNAQRQVAEGLIPRPEDRDGRGAVHRIEGNPRTEKTRSDPRSIIRQW